MPCALALSLLLPVGGSLSTLASFEAAARYPQLSRSAAAGITGARPRREQGGRRVNPARRWRSQAAGPGLPRPPPAFYPARPGSGAGGRRVPASSLLGRRGGRSRGGGAANRRGRPVRAPRRLSAGWDRSEACDSAPPGPAPLARTRGGAAQPGREPPSLPGSPALWSPRVVARRWHPTPT